MPGTSFTAGPERSVVGTVTAAGTAPPMNQCWLQSWVPVVIALTDTFGGPGQRPRRPAEVEERNRQANPERYACDVS